MDMGKVGVIMRGEVGVMGIVEVRVNMSGMGGGPGYG
jgi:hypothetical protein